MPSDTTKIALAAGGGLILGAAVWYVATQRQEADEPIVVVKKKQPESTPAPASTETAPAPAKPATAATESTTSSAKPTEASTQGSMQRETTSALVNEYSFSSGDVPQAEKPSAGKGVYQPPVPDANGVIFLENLGLRFQVQRGWNVSEEASPMPNVAMVTFTKPEFAERAATGMPGETPVVLLSIEDISNEGIPADEFRERSKTMALGQMQMMTQGMFQPEVKEDAKLPTPIGPFTHTLHYALNTPYFSMVVLNLTTVVDGLAYIMQVMAAQKDFNSVRDSAVTMCKTMALNRPKPPTDFRVASYVTVNSEAGTVQVPAAWSVEKQAGSNPVLKLSTPSTSRKESIDVFNVDLANVVDLSAAAAKKTVEMLGVTVTDYGSNLRVAKKGNVLVVATPQHTHDIVTTPETLAAIADSATLGASRDTGMSYRNKVLQFSFPVIKGSRVVESRLSERVVVYAPLGLPTDPSAMEDTPMLTIRCGDPSNDPDCRGTLDEWIERIKTETDADNITQLKKETINQMQAVTFVNKEMQEVGPGQKEERTAKVVIFVKEGRTTMLRWETSSGGWRKHETKLNNVLSSFIVE